MSTHSNNLQFKNLHRNLGWNFSGQFLGKSSLLLFHIILANHIGAEEYGKFSFVFVGGLIILQPALDLGFNQIITKWISRGNTEVVKLAFRIKVIISIFLIPLVFFVGWWFDVNLLLLLTVIGFFFFNTIQQSLFGILRGIEDLRPESIVSALQNILACAALVIIVFQEYKEPWIGSLILMISRFLGTIIFSVVLFEKYSQKLRDNKNQSLKLKTNELWREALTLGMTIFLIQFYFRIDTIMLGLISSETEVGLYSVAYNIMEGTFFIPTIVMATIFPGLSQTKKFLAYFRKGAILLTITGLFTGGIVFLLSNLIINWFFSTEFQKSAEILEILALTIPLVFWGNLMTQSLVATDHNRVYLVITFFGLILNVLLNLWFIPEYGASGAAVTTVITEAIIPLICFIIIKKHNFAKSPLNVS